MTTILRFLRRWWLGNTEYRDGRVRFFDQDGQVVAYRYDHGLVLTGIGQSVSEAEANLGEWW